MAAAAAADPSMFMREYRTSAALLSPHACYPPLLSPTACRPAVLYLHAHHDVCPHRTWGKTKPRQTVGHVTRHGTCFFFAANNGCKLWRSDRWGPCHKQRGGRRARCGAAAPIRVPSRTARPWPPARPAAHRGPRSTAICAHAYRVALSADRNAHTAKAWVDRTEMAVFSGQSLLDTVSKRSLAPFSASFGVALRTSGATAIRTK